MALKALVFDVFGTVVDWRGTVAREMADFGAAKGLDHDWNAFALSWRAKYQPAMAQVRAGDRGFVKLDVLHRENLEVVLAEFAIDGLSEAEKDHLNRIWHRLQPWPDSLEGLSRLKEKFIIATLSNGNVELMVNMAKNAGLPWDTILGAEVARAYKPDPQAYKITAAMLGCGPGECMLVAAHNNDLVAAQDCGLAAAFVSRPREYADDQDFDISAENNYDFVADNFIDLAAQLNC
jgi:2-haloacid dehalogenase